MKLLQRLATTSAVIAGAVLTAPSASAEDVDLEMVLLIDTSGSVDDDEFDKQMKGYINAFRDEEVQEAVLSHPNGVAVQVAQWSRGDNFATLDWQVLRTEEDCRALATSIFFFSRVKNGGTQMAPAIDKAMQALSTNNYDSPRQVIDVSGDGVCENWLFETTGEEHHDLDTGRPWSEVLADRPATLTINGIAIGVGNPHQPEIGGWYTDVLQQGDNSFALYVDSFEAFGEGIKTKLVREIVPPPPTISYD